MVIRQAHLTALSLMTSQAGIIRLPAGLNRSSGLGHQSFDALRLPLRHQIEARSVCSRALGIVMRLVAIGAANVIGRVRSSQPISHLGIAHVTTQADAVGIGRGAPAERNDFRDVPAGLDVQTAGTMTLFTFDALLRVEGVAKILGDIRMTSGAGLRTRWGRPRNLYELSKSGNGVVGVPTSPGRKTIRSK